MAAPSISTNLSPKDAVIDTLHRCILGLDTNDGELFASTILKSPDTTVIGGGYTMRGWAEISPMFERVFSVVTTHFITNIRVELTGEEEAKVSCHALACHVKPDEAMGGEDKSYRAGCLYFLQIVRADAEWKIRRWEIRTQWTTGDIKVLHAVA